MSKPTVKRRNNEKRKEKSRVAARCRRNKEQHIFQDLTEALPVRKEDVEPLDKSSIMRLAIAYLKCRDVVGMLPELHPEESKAEKCCPLKAQESYLQALDGFVLVVSQIGDVLYCSENIADHLGVSQLELMGQSLFDFSHLCDHDELREVLRSRPATSAGARGPAHFPLRVKCTLTSKGRSVHLKSASYKVIQFTGHMVATADVLERESNNNKPDDTKPDEGKPASLVAVGRSIPHPANIEIPLDNKTFLTKHSLNMKFTYSDDVMSQSLGFEADELVGQSLYDHHHAADVAVLAQHFKTLFSKGQCETGRYRFLAKSGGYAWVQTQATLITDKQQKPVSVVCVNFFISGIECKDEVFSANQMRHADLKAAPQVAAAPTPVETESVVTAIPAPASPCQSLPDGAIVEEISNGASLPVAVEEARPRPATAQIFAPRTEDMNKGYLMFSEDDPGLTIMKEEPDDLTHLAPTAGDACIPLEDNPFDMFDEFILNDNYCSLLGEDLVNGSPVDSIGADSLLLSSPETQESDSSCEQSSLLTELSLDGLDGGRSEGELDGRAPYIPMTGGDELPLLAPAVMWGALPDNVSLARPAPAQEAMPPPATPALQLLLAAPSHTGPPPQDIITNIYNDQGLIPNGSVTTWDTGIKRRGEQDDVSAKRSKRSPPAMVEQPPQPAPTSSVLMNLLDVPGPPLVHRFRRSTQAFLPPCILQNSQVDIHKPSAENNLTSQKIPLDHNELSVASTHSRLPDISVMSPLSPLSINLGSPMMNSSPQISPYGVTSQVYGRIQINTTSPAQSSSSLSPVKGFSPGGDTLSSGGMGYSPGRNSLSSSGFSPEGIRLSTDRFSHGGLIQTACDPFLNKMLSPNSFQDKPSTGYDQKLYSPNFDIDLKMLSPVVLDQKFSPNFLEPNTPQRCASDQNMVDGYPLDTGKVSLGRNRSGTILFDPGEIYHDSLMDDFVDSVMMM